MGIGGPWARVPHRAIVRFPGADGYSLQRPILDLQQSTACAAVEPASQYYYRITTGIPFTGIPTSIGGR
jgi:hypothetical protein